MSRTVAVRTYLETLRGALVALESEPLEAAAEMLEAARRDERTVFVFGNGGSAATASHLACDFAKNTRSCGRGGLRMVCLASDAATLTAYANDEGYEVSFAEPLRTLARPGDVAIAISAGGNSPNVVRALEVAREMGVRTLGLTGPGGGALATKVDVCIRAASPQIEHVEDVHLVVTHLLTVRLRSGER
jgi:D-sedoheptulose 7-phosphate isomerase